jgi:hypothetical protein
MKGKSKVKSQKSKVIQRELTERLLVYGSRIIKVVEASERQVKSQKAKVKSQK